MIRVLDLGACAFRWRLCAGQCQGRCERAREVGSWPKIGGGPAQAALGYGACWGLHSLGAVGRCYDLDPVDSVVAVHLGVWHVVG